MKTRSRWRRFIPAVGFFAATAALASLLFVQRHSRAEPGPGKPVAAGHSDRGDAPHGR